MVKQPVKVFIRTRPTTRFADKNIKVIPDKKEIDIVLPKKKVNHLNNRKNSFQFHFDGILHDSSQEQVFDSVGKDVIDSLFEGYNCTIFCYGQTGAGKTYTMTGPPENTSDYRRRGLIPRTIEYIFEEIHNKPEKSFKIYVSYSEVYMEKISDLLNYNNPRDPKSSHKGRGNSSNNLQIIELKKDHIFVRGLKKFPVKDEEEALALMFEGENQRAICEHVLNADSSRSHAIFTIYVESKEESTGQIISSKLHLVDLAGSERLKKTQSKGRVLMEANYINKSLTFLEQVVVALSTSGRDHIPYRQSVLTHLLKDSIGGNCKTTMVANMWGERDMIEETLSTLKFGSRMMRVSNVARVNVEITPSMLISKYEKRVRELKEELAMHDQIKGVNQVEYDDYTEEQKLELRKELWKFVNKEKKEENKEENNNKKSSSKRGKEEENKEHQEQDKDEIPTIKNLKQVKESFLQFRIMINNLQHELKSNKEELEELKQQKEEWSERGGDGMDSARKKKDGKKSSKKSANKSRSKSRGRKNKDEKQPKQKQQQSKGGDLEEENGFSLGDGIPSSNLKKKSHQQQQRAKSGKKKQEEQQSSSKNEEKKEMKMVLKRNEKEDEDENISKDEKELRVPKKDPISKSLAYEIYKKDIDSGRERFEGIRKNVEIYKEKKSSFQNDKKKLTDLKDELSELRSELSEKKQQKKDHPNAHVVDEETQLILREFKTKRTEFQKISDEMKQKKDELRYLGQRITQLKKIILREFDEWYANTYGEYNVEDDELLDKESKELHGSWMKTNVVLGSGENQQNGSQSDRLDDGEMFEKLEEERIKKKDPESLTYFKAMKKSRINRKRKM